MPRGRQWGIETHPQRTKVIDALIAGESVRSIASWCDPPIHYMSLQRYRAKVVLPALRRAGTATKVLRDANLVDSNGKPAENAGAAMEVTKQALIDGPVLAVRDNRLAALQDRHDRLRQVMIERGADPSMQIVPGGKTGLLCRTLKSVGSGPNSQIVEEFEIDETLLKEFREHEKQVAIELGQWQETAGPTTNNLTVVLMPTDTRDTMPLQPVTTPKALPDPNVQDTEFLDLPSPDHC